MNEYDSSAVWKAGERESNGSRIVVVTTALAIE